MDNTEDLRSTVEMAFDAAETPETTTVETTTEQTEQAKAERARDEAGRFAPKANEPVVEQKQPGATQPAPVVDAAALPSKKAPASWKPEAAAVWAKIDADQPLTPEELRLFRDEAARREGDFHKGVEGWKQHAQAGKSYQEALAPYQETLTALGVDGVTAVKELMKADHVLRHAPESVKLQKLLELAQVYRIDLSKQFTPEIARYEQELFATKEQLKTIQSQNQQSADAAITSDIDRFAAAPGHELFEDVRAHMAALLSGGTAQDLEDAYQQAVFANPQTRAKLLEQQQRASAEAARLQRVKAAAGSVRGSSPASGTPSAAGNSVRDAVSAAFDAHS